MGAFSERHLGPRDEDVQTMLDALGYKTLDDLTQAVVSQKHSGQL